ncbi:Putative uncharacterized protein [Moritella viscosa]|nr:Putative uncharacterized protein [Moritella viscosa]
MTAMNSVMARRPFFSFFSSLGFSPIIDGTSSFESLPKTLQP